MGRRSATQSDVSGGGHGGHGGHGGRSHRSGRTTMAREGQSGGGERERKGERRFAKVS